MTTDDPSIIDSAFDRRHELSVQQAPLEVVAAVNRALLALDTGQLRVAEPTPSGWRVHQWLKKAILLSFRLAPSRVMPMGSGHCFDKIPLKYRGDNEAELHQWRGRMVPGAIVRQGAYLAADTVIMPSFINTGAYVGQGTLIDTWATVGSCAQIGQYVHLSGGAGIGGVLEPLQANPTIIEDHVFIGARSEIVEGVIVEHHAVISMGVFIGQSTKIYDRATGEVSYGRVPSGAVVVPGSLPSEDGRYALNCAVIVKRVDEKTRAKISINELLRG